MAQHKTTKRGTKLTEKKVFTLAQATRALPYVSRVVSDIVSAHQKAIDIQSTLQAIPPGTDRSARQQAFERAIDRLQELQDELKVVGVELKDYATGTIDFPARHKGRPVFLSWQHNQPGISHFHLPEATAPHTIDTLDERD